MNSPSEPYPGGSTFNAVISLARAGVPATFISEAGHDRVGQNIIRFLQDNGVDASNVNVFPGSRSPISLAFLDDNNDAEYIFYKDHPHDQARLLLSGHSARRHRALWLILCGQSGDQTSGGGIA